MARRIDAAGYGMTSLPGIGTTGVMMHAAGSPTTGDYFAGEFFIDTGYNDPVDFTGGVQGAELYIARVYGKSGNHIPSRGASGYVNLWRIESTVLFGAAFYETPATAEALRRVYIRCRAYASNPAVTSAGSWSLLNVIEWALYRA